MSEPFGLLQYAQETAEDAAVQKVIEEAVSTVTAGTLRVDTSPQVTMREGQNDFSAAPETKPGRDMERITTEAEIVAPDKGVGAGDRMVPPKRASATAFATVKVSSK